MVVELPRACGARDQRSRTRMAFPQSQAPDLSRECDCKQHSGSTRDVTPAPPTQPQTQPDLCLVLCTAAPASEATYGTCSTSNTTSVYI
jgi:hypothetical protein